MREPERSYLLDVRRGKIGEQECLTRAGELERELADLETTSPLPDAPEEGPVEEWVLGATDGAGICSQLEARRSVVLVAAERRGRTWHDVPVQIVA